MPKRIKFEGDIFELDEDNVYKSSENGNFLTDSINFNLSNLNDYVEILEDEEEIDIENLEEIKGIVAIDEKGYITRETFLDFINKINDLVKAVKQLDKNKVDYIQPYKEE